VQEINGVTHLLFWRQRIWYFTSRFWKFYRLVEELTQLPEIPPSVRAKLANLLFHKVAGFEFLTFSKKARGISFFQIFFSSSHLASCNALVALLPGFFTEISRESDPAAFSRALRTAKALNFGFFSSKAKKEQDFLLSKIHRMCFII